MDISKLCRSCMKEVAWWERENFDPRAVDMFCFVTNIAITDEKLPKQFCYDCIIKIESTYIYITEVHRVDATLKNIASRCTTSVIIEPTITESHIKHTEHIKLTLPDYKICATINNYTDNHTFDTIDIPNNLPNENTDKTLNLNIEDTSVVIEKNVDNIEINTTKEKNILNKVESVKLNTNTEVIKKNVCPVCRKSFASKTWFNKHMQKEHSGHKYACTHCPKTFTKMSQLTCHSACHSDERKFACNACGKRFKRGKQLTIHARAHADVRPYACDHCSMRFKMKSILKCHMKVHDGQKQFLCSYCGWSFAQAGNLEVHMRKHTGEKPFSCNECSFRAAVASNLRRHQRRHREARIYVCKHCNKGFYDASALARHTRTHTGELPYQCPGCARSFADSWKRKTHLMRAHRLQLTEIPRMRRDGLAIH